jgi:pyruvate,water dikinase
VTSITDPDWVPIMKRASAIVTDHGGRTSHAAIVSRELGCRRSSAPATRRMSCMTAGSDGLLRRRRGVPSTKASRVTTEDVSLDDMPQTKTRRSCSTSPIRPPPSAGGACPPTASGWRGWSSSSTIQVHPMALVNFDSLPEGRGSQGHRSPN